MTAFPSAIATISPVTGFTVATSKLLLDHTTDLIVASVGSTVAIRVALAPASSNSVVLSRVILVTLTGGSFSLPSCLVPSWITVTINVLLPERIVIVASRRSPV